MLRNIDLKEISDGRLYDANDMVKAGSDDCSGCWDCCQGMGTISSLHSRDNVIFVNGCFLFWLSRYLDITKDL